MKVDVQKAIKPLRELHDLLKDFPVHPSPEEVHRLRTHARRLEAIVHTFSSGSDRDAQHLLKLIKVVRKATGKVRDLDVFVARLREVQAGFAAESLVRLTGHVAGFRDKQAARLNHAIERSGRQVRRSIKQYVRTLESSGEGIIPAAPQVLAAQLDKWPKVQASNLHEFRIRAKELRYMLQLAPDADQQRIEVLSKVKDAAGEWHDWLELNNLAKEVLDPEADRQILQQIAATKRDKLRAGLDAANRVRKLSLEVPRAA
jgi:CHAD domain-containing protein